MSGTIVELTHDPKWGWMLLWGRETFYDDDRCLLTWDTAADAEAWYNENAPPCTRLVKPQGQLEFLDI